MFILKLTTKQKMLITALCFGVAFYGFMIKLPSRFHHYDKELHSLFYFGAAAFLNFLFVGKKWWAHVLVFIGLFLMGVGIEWAQEFSNGITGSRIHGRFDPEDVKANTQGLVIFSVLWLVGIGINALVRSNEKEPTQETVKQPMKPIASVSLQSDLSRQFGAALKMVENAIVFCPDHMWDTPRNYWYQAYHVLFFADYYLSKDPANFQPPFPFDSSEFEDRMPNRVYTKAELLHYMAHCRAQFLRFIPEVKHQGIQSRWINSSKTMDYSYVEIVLYNMRHLQHHAAQMNLILREEGADVPDWVFQFDIR